MEAREYKEFYEEAMHATAALDKGKSAQVLRFPNGKRYTVIPKEVIGTDVEADFEVDESERPEWLTPEVEASIKRGLADVKADRVHSLEDVKREIYG